MVARRSNRMSAVFVAVLVAMVGMCHVAEGLQYATAATAAEARVAAAAGAAPSLFSAAMKEQAAWAAKHTNFLAKNPQWLKQHVALTTVTPAVKEALRLREEQAAAASYEAVVSMQRYRIEKNTSRMRAMVTQIEQMKQQALAVEAAKTADTTEGVAKVAAIVAALQARTHSRSTQHFRGNRRLLL